MTTRFFLPSILLIGFIAGSFSSPSKCAGQSLFERRSTRQIGQYSDYAARGRGDLLTILINENTDFENRDERSMDKTGSSSYSGGLNYGFGGDLGSTSADGTLGSSSASTRNFSGDAEFRSAREFTDRISVSVVDLLPNGTLVVSGRRSISFQGDTRELIVSGLIRPFDILPNNSVPSHLVANLKIQLSPAGPEPAYTQQGWFSRKLNRFWPF